MNFYSRIQRIDAMLDHNSEKWLSYSGIPTKAKRVTFCLDFFATASSHLEKRPVGQSCPSQKIHWANHLEQNNRYVFLLKVR